MTMINCWFPKWCVNIEKRPCKTNIFFTDGQRKSPGNFNATPGAAGGGGQEEEEEAEGFQRDAGQGEKTAKVLPKFVKEQ